MQLQPAALIRQPLLLLSRLLDRFRLRPALLLLSLLIFLSLLLLPLALLRPQLPPLMRSTLLAPMWLIWQSVPLRQLQRQLLLPHPLQRRRPARQWLFI